MKCQIKAESRGRIRVHAMISRMSLAEADILEYYLRAVDGVRKVRVFDRTCDVTVEYVGDREDVICALAAFAFSDEEAAALVPEHTGRATNRRYQDRMVWLVTRRYVKRLLLPHNVRVAVACFQALKYIREGLKALWRRNLNVSVLDATAITVFLLRDDHDTAASVMFLLSLGELLEEWVRKKSVDDLAGMMSLNVEKVWLCAPDGDVLVPVSQVEAGDTIVVRTGNMIPLDGKVIDGEAMFTAVRSWRRANAGSRWKRPSAAADTTGSLR